MSTYRKEWPCCGDVTETQAWEPQECPFCTPVATLAQPEPVAWLRDQRGEYEGPATLEPLFLLGASQPAIGARYGKATYSPLYAAPQEAAK